MSSNIIVRYVDTRSATSDSKVYLQSTSNVHRDTGMMRRLKAGEAVTVACGNGLSRI